MKSNKGQLTVFVILGIVLIILLGVFFMNLNSKNKTQFENNDINELDSSTQVVKMYINECILDLLRSNINKYGVDEKSKENIEWEILSNVNKCVSNENFINQGIEIKSGDPSLSIEIDEIIQVELLMNVNIIKDSKESSLSSFKVEIPGTAPNRLMKRLIK
jgi:hypothetical protein